MKAKQMMVMAALVASLLAFGGESFAAKGGNAGGGRGARLGSPATDQVRPEGSQRRDGSFLSTGTTASGATTRPGKGRGVMDGTGINHPSTTAPATTP